MSEATDHSGPYLKEVERLVRHLHQPRFRRLWTEPTLKGEGSGRFQLVQNLAFIYAVLHKTTGKGEYLELARRYLRDPDRGFHFTSLFVATAYEMLSKHLTRGERQSFAEQWLPGIDWCMEHFVGDEDQDWSRLRGVSNHALCTCVFTDYARRLFPELVGPRGYERRTDRLWDVWWATREFHEQAPCYEGFSNCFHCAWAELRGVATEFYASPGVRNMLERGLRITSPAGIVTAYGDSPHYEHATAYIALFEKAGAQMQDGEFKQAAYEVFRCLQKLGMDRVARRMDDALELHLCSARAVYGDFINEVSWLAMAALWSDSKLEPLPRKRIAGLVRRLPYNHKLTAADKKRLPKEMTTCQVALTGGPPDPDRRTYLLVSVGPKLVHDHEDAGSILMLSRGTCCLLGTNGYLQREHLYHNAFYVQKSSWEKYPEDAPGRALGDAWRCKSFIEELQIHERSSYCRVRFENYSLCPIELRREIIVDPAGDVTLIDRVVAPRSGYCGGPLFHAERIRKTSAKSYLLRTDLLCRMNGAQIENPPGELLVETVHPRADVRVVRPRLPAVYTEGYKGFPLCHYKRLWAHSYTARRCLAVRTEFPKGKEVLFVTCLRPQ